MGMEKRRKDAMTPALRRVKRAATARARARGEFNAAIVAAHEEGESLAAIGRVAGVTYIRVLQIVQEAKNS
jgi:hypothetical protein